MTCGCGLQVTEGGLLRHRRGSHHLSWLNSQTEVPEKDKPIPCACDRMMCECGCELSITHSPLDKHHINRHKQTEKHMKRMTYVEKGLDPDVETAREEEQRRTEHRDNGGRERDWLSRVDFMANLPSNKEWCEAFLKKREHLPEWAKHKDKIKAIRDKMESPPYPPISDEELKARREKMKAKN